MAACHSLEVDNGKIVGDPLDLEIFNHSDSKLDVPIMKVPKKNIFAAFATSFAANFAAAFTASVGNSKISQLKQFPFSSELARRAKLNRTKVLFLFRPGLSGHELAILTVW